VRDEGATNRSTPYEALGGEAFVRDLCARFYALMDSLPEARACRQVHPLSLANAERKLFEYLTGWLGGPPLYTDQYGHPRLRQRHFVAPIGAEEARGWLICLHRAGAETAPESASRQSEMILERIDQLAAHMVNRDAVPA